MHIIGISVGKKGFLLDTLSKVEFWERNWGGEGNSLLFSSCTLVMCIHSFESLKENKYMRSIQIELLVGVWCSSSSWQCGSNNSAELVDSEYF